MACYSEALTCREERIRKRDKKGEGTDDDKWAGKKKDEGDDEED